MNRHPRTRSRLGLRRGWTEFVAQHAQPPGPGLLPVHGRRRRWATCGCNRDTEVEGTDLLLPSVALPSILGALLAFGVIIGPAYALAMERRTARCCGTRRCRTGCRATSPASCSSSRWRWSRMLLVILVPSFLLFDDLMTDAVGLADRRLGARRSACWRPCRSAWSSGSVVPSVQKVGTWGMLPVLVLTASPGSSTRSRRCGAGCRSWRRSSRCTGSASACGRRSSPRPRPPLEVGGSWRTGRPCSC